MAKIYSTSIDLRFSDFDIYGHVNSVVYFNYLETARVKLFNDVFRDLTDRGIFIVVGRAECEYCIPILPDDAVTVEASVSRIGNTSFDLDYRLHNGAGKVFANARTMMVCFDNVVKAPTVVPECLRELA